MRQSIPVHARSLRSASIASSSTRSTLCVLTLLVWICAGPALATDYQENQAFGDNSGSVHTQVLTDRASIHYCVGQAECCCTHNCGTDDCSPQCVAQAPPCSKVGAGENQASCPDPNDSCAECCLHQGEEQWDKKIHQVCCTDEAGCGQGRAGCNKEIKTACLTTTTCASPVKLLCDDSPTNLCPEPGESQIEELLIPSELSTAAVADLLMGDLDIYFVFSDGSVLSIPLSQGGPKEPPVVPPSPAVPANVPALPEWGLAALAGLLVLGAALLIHRRHRSRRP